MIAVSQSSMQMNVVFPDESPSDPETVTAYIAQRYREIFDAFAIIKGVNALFFGVTTQVHVPTHLPDQELLKRLARHLLKSPEETRGGYFDVQVKQTKIIDKKLFHNITLANYRVYKFDALPDAVPRFPMSKVVERGVEIIGDVNDRHAYNRQQAYRTSIVTAGDIVGLAMSSTGEAIAQVKAMAE